MESGFLMIAASGCPQATEDSLGMSVLPGISFSQVAQKLGKCDQFLLDHRATPCCPISSRSLSGADSIATRSKSTSGSRRSSVPHARQNIWGGIPSTAKSISERGSNQAPCANEPKATTRVAPNSSHKRRAARRARAQAAWRRPSVSRRCAPSRARAVRRYRAMASGAIGVVISMRLASKSSIADRGRTVNHTRWRWRDGDDAREMER